MHSRLFQSITYVALAACTAINPAMASRFYPAIDGWALLDRNGIISPMPQYFEEAPPWKDWVPKQRRGYSPHRIKNLPNGQRLRFDDWDWNITCPTRQLISLRSDDGRVLSYGYADADGVVVIQPAFDKAENFVNGFAVVRRTKKQPWVVINEKGVVVYTLPENIEPDFQSGFDGVSKEETLPVKKDAVATGFYDLKKHAFHPLVGSINQASDGLYLIADRHSIESYGYADTQGRMVISGRFERADWFSEGLACVKQKNHFAYIDKSGKYKISLPENCVDAGPFSEGLASVAMKDAKGDVRWGFINSSGAMVISPQFWVGFSNRPRFEEGLACVAIGNGVFHRYGFIDSAGTWVIQPKFRDTWHFRGFKNGRALVRLGDSGFHKDEWLRAPLDTIDRCRLFDLFLREFGLIGMTSNEVHRQLGEPDGHFMFSDYYELVHGDCGNAYRRLEIRYFFDKAVAYRFNRFFAYGTWINESGWSDEDRANKNEQE